MSWIRSVFELSETAPADGEVVEVGAVSRYRFQTSATDTPDGIYVIAPSTGAGRWLRLGPPGLTLTEAGLGASPSRKSTRASGTGGDHDVTLAAPMDFQNGDAVVVHGAGPGCRLSAPGPPRLRASAKGSTSYSYAAVAVSQDRSYTMVGAIATVDDAPDALSDDCHVEVEWHPEDVDPDAHLLIIYRRRGTGPWEAIGGLVANPYRFRDPDLVSEPIRVVLVDTGRERLAGLAAWLPGQPPSETGAGQLQTRIVAGGGSTRLRLESPLETTITRGEFRHDAGRPFQRAIDAFRGRIPSDGGRLHIPAGEYEVHARVRVDKRCLIEGDGRNQTRLFFMDGCGLEIEGQHTSRQATTGQQTLIRDLTLTYSSKKTIPAGNPVALSSQTLPEAATSVQEWFHGALVLVTAQCEFHAVDVQSAVGNGFVFYGWPALSDGSVNVNCNVSLVVSCSVTGSLGHGFAVRGSDANQIAFIQADVVGCEGWGFLDRSFLGCHFYATHTSANRRGAYLTSVDVASSTYVGAYSESGLQRVSSAAQGTIIVGGVHGAKWRAEERSLKLYQFDQPGIQPGLHIHHADGAMSTQLGQARSNSPELRRYASTHDGQRLNHFRMFVRSSSESYIRDHYSTSRLVSREWLGPNARGSGLIRYPRGLIMGRGSTQRRISMTDGTALGHGAYDSGDILLDASGRTLCARPRHRFALGPIWSSDRVVHVGDTVVPTQPNGRGYVAVDVRDPRSVGRTGDTEPEIWPTTPAEQITDGVVVWECWGGDTADLQQIGPAVQHGLLSFGTIAPNTTAASTLTVKGVGEGDAVVPTPEPGLPDGLLWAGHVHAPDHVEIRLANLTTTPIAVPDTTWHVAVHPA